MLRETLSAPGKWSGAKSPGSALSFLAGKLNDKGTEQMVEGGTKEEPHREIFGHTGKRHRGVFVGEERWLFCRSNPDREKAGGGGDKPELQKDPCG